MTAHDIAALKAFLVSSKAVPATASDGDVAAAHQDLLNGPNATEYKAALVANGIPVSTWSWLTVLGLLGGGVAVYFIWKHYQKPKQVSSFEYPDDDEPTGPRVRQLGRALAPLRDIGRHSLSGGRRAGGCRAPVRRRRGLGAAAPTYEFEPETRLEGYRRKRR